VVALAVATIHVVAVAVLVVFVQQPQHLLLTLILL
jgi:hypothetical protein